MEILFIIIYILFSEVTYNVALHQSMGLVKYSSIGGLCWIGRIILIIPCIYYCGWLFGILLFLFMLFGFLHMTIGWILSIPSMFVKNDNQIMKIVNLECSLVIPLDIGLLIFTIISFFTATYKSTFNLFTTYKSIVILIVVLIIGFIVRSIVYKLMPNE